MDHYTYTCKYIYIEIDRYREMYLSLSLSVHMKTPKDRKEQPDTKIMKYTSMFVGCYVCILLTIICISISISISIPVIPMNINGWVMLKPMNITMYIYIHTYVHASCIITSRNN